jgi:hypothetical protein
VAAIALHPLLTAAEAVPARPTAECLSVNVSHVIVGLEVGGAELMLPRLIACSHETGEARHSVVSLTGVGIVGAKLQTAGVAVHALGLKEPADILRGLIGPGLTRDNAQLMTWIAETGIVDVGDAALLVGRTGLVVPKEDPRALRQAIGLLTDLSDPERRARAADAQARMEGDFSIHVVCQRYSALYRQVVGRRRENA